MLSIQGDATLHRVLETDLCPGRCATRDMMYFHYVYVKFILVESSHKMTSVEEAGAKKTTTQNRRFHVGDRAYSLNQWGSEGYCCFRRRSCGRKKRQPRQLHLKHRLNQPYRHLSFLIFRTGTSWPVFLSLTIATRHDIRECHKPRLHSHESARCRWSTYLGSDGVHHSPLVSWSKAGSTHDGQQENQLRGSRRLKMGGREVYNNIHWHGLWASRRIWASHDSNSRRASKPEMWGSSKLPICDHNVCGLRS